MELRMVEVTPQVAAEMLEDNIDINRSIKNGHLEKLCYDMKHGFWDSTNGETLKFKAGKEGQKWGILVDGQHRLTAIISTGMSFTLPCMIGVSEDSFATLDSGSSRSFADILSQKEVGNKTGIAAGVLTLEQFYMGNFKKSRVSHRRLLSRFNDHKSIAEYGNQAARLRIVFRPSEAIFISYVFNSISPKKGKAFLHRLQHGGAEEGTPVHILREKLLNYRIKRPTGYVYTTKDHIVGSVFKAWNMQQRNSNDTFEMLKVGEDIEYPVGFKDYFTDIEIGGIER